MYYFFFKAVVSVLSEKTEPKPVSAADDEKAQILARARERIAKKEENAKKPDLFKVIIFLLHYFLSSYLAKVVLAQAASEAVQLKSREEIPPPTNKEIAQKHGRKVVALI